MFLVPIRRKKEKKKLPATELWDSFAELSDILEPLSSERKLERERERTNEVSGEGGVTLLLDDPVVQ